VVLLPHGSIALRQRVISNARAHGLASAEPGGHA
jgi:hypothetical protein